MIFFSKVHVHVYSFKSKCKDDTFVLSLVPNMEYIVLKGDTICSIEIYSQDYTVDENTIRMF